MNLKGLIVRRLNDHLDEMESFVDGLPIEQLAQRPSPEKWSIAENILHIIDAQDVYIEWVARMLVEDKPRLDAYFIEDHTGNQYIAADLDRRLREFSEQRKNLIALLGAMTDKQWKHEGVHSDVKHFTIEKCMEGLMRHEESHLYEMFNIFFGVKE